MLWTVVPAAVLAVIIILGLKTWNSVTDNAKKESIRVELFSRQWTWIARYSGDDNTLGNFDYKLTTAKNQLGLLTSNTIDSAIFEMEYGVEGIKTLEDKLNDNTIMLVPEEKELMIVKLDRKERLIRLLYQMKARHNKKVDAFAWDDIIEEKTLYLCENKEYEFIFRSQDVIHSAYFPHFRAQMNTVPGLTTRFKFTPNITTKQMRVIKQDNNFDYILLCNKICGTAHYNMFMKVVVLPEEEYVIQMNKMKAENTFKHLYFPVVGAPVAPAETTTDLTAVVAK